MLISLSEAMVVLHTLKSDLHATESLDLEVGAKYMYMNTVVKQGTVTYDFRDLTSFYGSVIFKWQMD